MTHKYETTRILPIGTVYDYCLCGFKVRYHMASEHERQTAELAMRGHLRGA